MTVAIRSGPVIMAREGDEVLLQPVVTMHTESASTANAGLSFDWLKDGTPVSFGPRVKPIGRDSLKITSVQRSDRGVYQVLVK